MSIHRVLIVFFFIVSFEGNRADSEISLGGHTLKVGQEALLVELGALQTERGNNVVDLDLGVVEVLASFLGRGVGTDVCLRKPY